MKYFLKKKWLLEDANMLRENKWEYEKGNGPSVVCFHEVKVEYKEREVILEDILTGCLAIQKMEGENQVMARYVKK